MIIIKNKNIEKKIKSYKLGLVLKKKNIIFFKKKKICIKNILTTIIKNSFFIKNIIKDTKIKILAKKKEIKEISKFLKKNKIIKIESIFLKKRIYKIKICIYDKNKTKKNNKYKRAKENF
ncbi:hypothetical protein ONB67_00335 [Candidatus Vidania fulgoroideae]|uniref:Uncharacterized protein n=1 Tax=Candidatus Vidania fulgoroideorum TaxID=881286 RepID=A0AAX3N938_9PROT|nr:hypothetical protein ONB67_00335 [Candidatus Vidania fulgoroideae]